MENKQIRKDYSPLNPYYVIMSKSRRSKIVISDHDNKPK